jgi:hypothetical protein
MCGNGRDSGDLTPPVLTFQFWPQAWDRCGQMAENSAAYSKRGGGPIKSQLRPAVEI